MTGAYLLSKLLRGLSFCGFRRMVAFFVLLLTAPIPRLRFDLLTNDPCTPG
jgi:hypothetical protein